MSKKPAAAPADELDLADTGEQRIVIRSKTTHLPLPNSVPATANPVSARELHVGEQVRAVGYGDEILTFVTINVENSLFGRDIAHAFTDGNAAIFKRPSGQHVTINSTNPWFFRVHEPRS